MRLRRPLPAVQGDTLHIVGVGDLSTTDLVGGHRLRHLRRGPERFHLVGWCHDTFERDLHGLSRKQSP